MTQKEEVKLIDTGEVNQIPVIAKITDLLQELNETGNEACEACKERDQEAAECIFGDWANTSLKRLIDMMRKA